MSEVPLYTLSSDSATPGTNLPGNLVSLLFGDFVQSPPASPHYTRYTRISSRRVSMMNARAQRKLLHTWIIFVIVNHHLVQIGRIDGRTDYVSSILTGVGSAAAGAVTTYSPHPTTYTPHPTPYTLHLTPYTLHPTPYTLHPSPYTPSPADPAPSAAEPEPAGGGA